MKNITLVLATACLAGTYAFGIQADSKTQPDNTKAVTDQNKEKAKANHGNDNDDRGKSKKKHKEHSVKKTEAKEPTENEKIFDEIFRAAQGGGV